MENEDYDDEDIDEDDCEWDEMELFNDLTVVEKQNPIIYLRDGFSFIQGNYGEYYTNLLNFIGAEGMTVLDSKIKEVEKEKLN